jgi:hypothetical protein
LVFLSVSLTARKPGKDMVEGNVYLRKSIARHRLAPALAVAIAGRLDYARCGWLDRQLIRFIMKLTGGPTDLKASIEFTAWNVVDDLAPRTAVFHRRIQPLRRRPNVAAASSPYSGGRATPFFANRGRRFVSSPSARR